MSENNRVDTGCVRKDERSFLMHGVYSAVQKKHGYDSAGCSFVEERALAGEADLKIQYTGTRSILTPSDTKIYQLRSSHTRILAGFASGQGHDACLICIHRT